jgi:TolB-like protein
MGSQVLKFRLAQLVLVAAMLFPTTAFGQASAKPHVAVVGFSNQTGVTSYDAACKTVSDSLLLAFEQLGRYTVQSLTQEDCSESGLRTLAETQNLDFVVYGTMTKKTAGGIVCDLSVFDRAKGKATISRTGKASGLLDIFDTADDLVVAVMESMTGTHVGFGSATLTNKGEPGSYAVSVDGYPVGENLQSLDKLLIGRHTVRITQRRMLGEREIAKADIAVAEGDTVDVQFAVPLLMDDEKAKLTGLKSSIQADWAEPGKATEVDGDLAQLVALLADISYSPRLAAQKGEAVQLGGEWTLRKCRAGIEGSAWNPSLAPLDAAGTVYQGAESYPDPAKIKQAFEEDAQLLALLFELAGGKALGDGDFTKASTSFGNELMLSTRYLNGARMTDYAYALTMIQAVQSDPSPQKLRSVFGPWIDAAKRFYACENKVTSGASIAVVASDLSRPLSIDGADLADTPLLLSPKESKTTLSVLPKGAEKPTTVEMSTGARLIFVSDGFAGFGKLALGTGLSNSAPGAIAVSVQPEALSFNDTLSAQASLDGGDPVDLPHTFEGVSAGSHSITVPETDYGTKRLKGFEETVTVEPGKRLEVSRTLAVGRALLHFNDIPEGATLSVDDEEQPLASPSNDTLYDVHTDAGSRKIDVVQGNKHWSTFQYVGIDGERTCSVKAMPVEITLQRKTIKLNGKTEDWAGVEPIFTAANNVSVHPKISGSQIAGGSICRDDRYLFIRMDFSNGKPVWIPNCTRGLSFKQNGKQENFQLAVWSNGTVHTDIYYPSTRTESVQASSVVGDSFIELRYPLSWFSRDFDFSESIHAQFFFWTQSGGDKNWTSTADIILGK